MYKSPIEVITEQINMQIENEVYKAVGNVGINIDREELLSALDYDRGQYTKGYKDRDSEIVRCKDCKHWDKTTREEGNDCISGPWEDAECEVFRDWDVYGDLGDHFRRTNGEWFCGDGEKR